MLRLVAAHCSLLFFALITSLSCLVLTSLFRLLLLHAFCFQTITLLSMLTAFLCSLNTALCNLLFTDHHISHSHPSLMLTISLTHPSHRLTHHPPPSLNRSHRQSQRFRHGSTQPEPLRSTANRRKGSKRRPLHCYSHSLTPGVHHQSAVRWIRPSQHKSFTQRLPCRAHSAERGRSRWYAWGAAAAVAATVWKR
jgi:hypothetical protein